MIELLDLIFGVGREQLPSEAEILRDFNQKITGTHSVHISDADATGVDREHLHRAAQILPVATVFNEKKTGTRIVPKTTLVAIGLATLSFLLLFYCYF